MIDTGSTENLLEPSHCPPQFTKKLDNQIVIKTAAGDINIFDECAIPKDRFQISLQNDIKFKVHKFHNFFNGLIGHKTMRNNYVSIDYARKEITFNKNKYKIYYQGDIETSAIIKPEIENLSEIYRMEYLGTIDEQLRLDHLNAEEKKAIMICIQNNENVFYKKGDNLTFTNNVKHKIDTESNKIVYTKTYRYPFIHKEEVERQMDEMLEQNIIRHSDSPYNSPIWIIPKKEDKVGNKEWRIVIDYRKLNEITREDKYPIPKIDEVLDSLGRANYFTTLDLTKGFYQIEVNPEDMEKTAFTTHNGHYEFVRMPFGLKNAPATFQRMMNNVLREHINKHCVVYMDDILVYSTSLEEHISRLNKIFFTLKQANLKVSLNKSDFLKKEAEFLGHVVTPQGIKPNPNKIEGIKRQQIPKTVKEIQSFLGLSGYYRKFIPNYAKIAKPMTTRLKKDAKINVNDEDYRESFNKLKTLLMSDAILQRPDFEKEFKLTTDASNYALGAVLSQDKGPIAFISRTLNAHEINYSTIEKELLAILWAVKQFRHYLYGRKFQLRTDHKPLIWLSNLKEPNSKLIRWKIKLNEYQFDISHLEGKENKVADALSRLKEINALEKKRYKCELCDKYYASSAAKWLHKRNKHGKGKVVMSKEKNPIIPHDTQTVHSAAEDDLDYFRIAENGIHTFDLQVTLQIGDENKTTTKPLYGKQEATYNYGIYSDEFIEQTLKEWQHYQKIGLYCTDEQLRKKFEEHYKKLKENSLFKYKPKICVITTKTLTVQYEEMLETIATHHRFENNHPGIEKTYKELKTRIYYPNLKTEITKFINNCFICNTKVERRPIKLPFEKTETPRTTHEHYHMDIWILERGKMYMTMIDKFSKFAQIMELEDRTTLALIKATIQLFAVMGKPKRLTTDNETGFKSELYQDFLEKNSVAIHYATANRHTGNSDIERLHATLIEHIRILKQRETQNDLAYNIDLPWQALNIYNHTMHCTTEEKPYVLHFANNRDFKEIYERIEKKKESILDNLNKNRRNENINKKFAKNTTPQKYESRSKPIHIERQQGKKYYTKHRILHKDQLIKQKRLSRSMDVLVDDTNDDQPSTSKQTNHN